MAAGQAGSTPGLLGGKAAWVPLVLELIEQVRENHALDLNAKPELSFNTVDLQSRHGGASPKTDVATWREYYGFLRGLGLVENTGVGLELAAKGLKAPV